MTAPLPGPARSAASRPVVVVMGVTGSGKSSVGARLAAALGCRFVEGDTLHPPENIARMSAGIPLTDEDREGWLDAIGRQLAAAAARGEGVVASCSALKRRYRDQLRGHVPGLVFVSLALDPETAQRRVAQRTDHFMPATLVASQFATLEPPAADEASITLDARLPVAELVQAASRSLAKATAGGVA
jgi:gluconokinase